jgi:hypothetical protein
MKKFISISCLLIAATFSVFAQDTTITGNYFGKNLYITNPTVENTSSYCISKITVNDKIIGDELLSNSLEIDFALYGITQNDPVTIKIDYTKGCKFKIVNPEVLQAKSTFAFTTSKADKTGKLIWTVKGEINSSFTVEQFRWNKWLTIGDVDINDTVHKNMYSFEIKPHYGQNLFRVSHTDVNGNTTYAKVIKYRSATAKEVMLASLKVTNQLDFSAETMYEIFDEKGNFISDGYSLSVDITDLPKGKYWVNYDNKSEMFTKK